MKKSLLLILSISFFGFICKSQNNTQQEIKELPIIKTDSLKHGVYFNFNEFLQNTPSLTEVKIIYLKRNSKLMEIPGAKAYCYNFFDQKHSLLHIQDSVWGFCDGENIYVKHKDDYFKIVKFGRFCLIVNSFISGINLGASSPYNTSHSSIEYILDINSGEIFKFKVSSLKKKILKYDKVLLEKFKDESLKKTMITKYLNDFNAKFQ